MKRAQVFPSTYLSKDDVPQPTAATVQDVRMETIKGEHGEEEKAVMHFDGDRLKAMILNTTNWTTLEEAYGDDSDLWRGKPVEVYVDPGVMYAGKRVGGVRLRVPAPSTNGRPAVPAAGLLTWEQAIAECAKAGIHKDELVLHLKKAGHTGYNTARDTKTVRDFIEQKAGEGEISFGPADGGPTNESIPF